VTRSGDGDDVRKLRRLLVANRGEIACRVMRSARELGVETIAVYSEPDRQAAHVAAADRAVALGGDSPATSYLDVARVVDAARSSGADAVHPGYGFLAENAQFAAAVEDAGLVFVGPTADVIAAMGDKIRSRELALRSSLPTIPAAELGAENGANERAAASLGYPVLVKAAAGGGGRGMRVVDDARSLPEAVTAARREAGAAFGDDRVYLEKYVRDPKHVEIQVFGDGRGKVLHLGERECSVQRRHQKIIEEAPSPVVDADLRARLGEAAVRLAGAMDYRGAGTVEFVVDAERNFYFLEMNTRLQVEHPVTELVTATDLVRWQLEIAAGGELPAAAPAFRGHAIECRVYAEDPANGFLPTAGRIHRVEHPGGPGVRVDGALFDGFEVPLEYDPLLAKVAVWAPDRPQAIARMSGALADFHILGITTNLPFLIEVVRDPLFAAGAFTTTTVGERYAHWHEEATEALRIAAAAASLLATRGGAATAARAAGRATPPGPWETLGAWRLGPAGRGGNA